MNYHAHIPAGVAFAAGACLVTHIPLSIPMLIAGGIGGALSDIDHPSGNGAVSSLGSKAGGLIQSATGGRVSMFKRIGMVGDMIVLKPLVRLWLLLARHVLSPLYMTMYKAFGSGLGWSDGDPAEHRGGLTHSIAFMLSTTLLMFPMTNFLMHDNLVLAGLELGILSHLFADSVCKSGIKWFWPWLPRIGYWDDTHEKGNGIRLIPVSWCMSTGKCPTRDDYLELGRGTKRYAEMRKAYYKEKGWQWGFKAAMVILTTLCITGVCGGAGSIAWGASQLATSPAGEARARTTQMREQAVKADVVSEIADGGASDGDESDGTTAPASTRVGEHRGPTSLTYGDIDATELPNGIAKMPDETLWVVGVGRVSPETLESPTLMLTQDEKSRLLAASTAQRLKDIPYGASEAIGSATDTARDAGKAVSDATSDFGDRYDKRGDDSGNGVTGALREMFGGSGDGHGFGFLGLTPYTSNPSSGS